MPLPRVPVFMLRVKTLPCFTYFHFRCIWSWHFLQNNLMEAALKLLCWEGSVDNSWTPCDWLHDSSFHWNHTFNVNWLSSSVNARTRAETQLLAEDCSARALCAPLPASCRDGSCLWLFQGVRENRLWWWWTSVWSQCEHTGCLSCGSQHLWLLGYFICALYTHKYWLLQRQKAGLPCGCMWVWFWM